MVVSTLISHDQPQISSAQPKMFLLEPDMAIKMLQRGNIFPDYVVTYSTLQTISKMHQNDKNDYFVYFVRDEGLWIIVKDGKWKHITMICRADHELSTNIFPIFDQLYNTHPNLFENQSGTDFHGLEKCYEMLSKWSEDRQVNVKFNGLMKTILYYLKPATIPKILKEDIAVPDDYEVVDIVPEKHGKMMLKTLAARDDYSKKFEDELMFNLQNMSAVAIKPKNSDDMDLASWVLQDVAGEMRCQYTFPQHRRRSLGNYCLKRLCQKMAKNAYFPYFEVLESNKNALNFNELYPDMAWQRWDEDSTPVTCMISVPQEWLTNALNDVGHKKPQEQIQIKGA